MAESHALVSGAIKARDFFRIDRPDLKSDPDYLQGAEDDGAVSAFGLRKGSGADPSALLAR